MTLGDWVNLVVAVATVLMAGATVYLGLETRKLAGDTSSGIDQAERHHRDSLRPYCVMEFNGSTEADPFGMSSMPATFNSKPAVVIDGEICNKGNGLAKDVAIYFNMRRGLSDDFVYRLTRPFVASHVLSSTDKEGVRVWVDSTDVIHKRVGNEYKPFYDNLSFFIQDVYECVLEYKDVFDNTFRTVYSRGRWHDAIAGAAKTNDPEYQAEMAIQPGQATPKFLVGRQSLRTVVDAAPYEHRTEPEPDRNEAAWH